MKVTELMNPHPVTVYGGDSVQKAAELMAQTGRGLLVVIDNIGDRKVIGVLSNKDIINKVIAKKISPTNRLVSEVMNREVVSIIPEAATSDAMALMRKHGIKRILVIENGILQGIISSNDIIDGMIKYKKQLLDMAIEF